MQLSEQKKYNLTEEFITTFLPCAIVVQLDWKQSRRVHRDEAFQGELRVAAIHNRNHEGIILMKLINFKKKKNQSKKLSSRREEVKYRKKRVLIRNQRD